MQEEFQMKNDNTMYLIHTNNYKCNTKRKKIVEPLFQLPVLQSIFNLNLTFGDCVTVQTHS